MIIIHGIRRFKNQINGIFKKCEPKIVMPFGSLRKAKRLQQDIESGKKTINEVRIECGLDPIEGTDLLIHKQGKQLDDKDIVCAARIIQSSIFENPIGIFFGCQYCKYTNECSKQFNENGMMHIDALRIKLQETTGVNLNYMYNPDDLEAKFK